MKNNWKGFITYHRIKRAQPNIDKMCQQMFEDNMILYQSKLNEELLKSCENNNNQPIDQEQ